ncbi:GTP-binding protein [Pricia sp. S334]|uniref:GTP-binding protein n=1 Tax=Pricia mediterranea TaxID=3076079 RepID=A0ABU3L150_9FLAO|nr:GTP-binding protein [Pricia sp. S334]MDT7827450.1 GTP-binding protein [Pricia sp. S334]
MKALSNEIALRPRFQLELATTKETLLSAFESSEKEPFLVKRSDDHIFIKFNDENTSFWSPQLQLEIVEPDDSDTSGSMLYGVFGPNPTLWTFFMFLHFGVATIFVILGIWAYSSASLDRPYGLQLGLMSFMVMLWFVLYAFGRAGRHKGKPQMQELYRFMREVLGR